jgi:hypothetical protein
VLADRSAGRPLDDSDLGTALHLAECAAQAMHAGEATAGSPTPGGQRSAVASPERGRGGADRQLQGSCDVMLPDVACVMAPSGQLYFNDAAWLGSEGARLVHEGLSHAAAEALGVRSMRCGGGLGPRWLVGLASGRRDRAGLALSSCIRFDV